MHTSSREIRGSLLTENAVHHVNGSSKTEASDNFRYWSFMSYSHADQKWADWLYKALETYRIPKGIKSAYASNLPKRLYPIFRDVDELPGSSDLGAKLKEALEASRTLIVLCSPSAAQSKWVNEEIGIFQAGGKGNRIFCVVVDGEPNAADPNRNCFPPNLRLGNREPLGCDPRDEVDGKKNALLRLVAGIVGLNYDALKQRDRQRRIRRRITLSIAGLLLVTVLGTIAFYAVKQQGAAASRALAADSERVLTQDPAAALKLAIESVRAAQTAEAAKALSHALRMQLTRIILEHSSPVIQATFSPGGTQVLSCTADGNAVVWDLPTPRVRFAMKAETDGENAGVRSCMFSPDGSTVLTVGQNAGARLWNANDGKLIAALKGHKGATLSGRFSPGGLKIVTTGTDKTARIWDTESGKNVLTYDRHDQVVSTAFFSPDGTRVISIGDQGGVFVWEADSGKTLFDFGEIIPFLQDAALSPDGTRLLISNYQYSAELWDSNTGRLVKRLTTRSLGAAFSPDSSLLVTGSGDGKAVVWEAKEGYQVKELMHDDPVDSVLFSPDGTLVITADEQPHIWNTPAAGGGTVNEIFSLHGHRGNARLADFSDDGKLLLTIGQSDNSIRVWDITAGAHVRSQSQTNLRKVKYAFDGSLIATIGKQVKIWNAKSWELSATLQEPVNLSEGDFSRDAKYFIHQCGKGIICVSGTGSGKLTSRIDNVRGLDFAISPDGSLAAIINANHDVVIYELPAVKQRSAFTGFNTSPNGLVFSPDGRRLFASSQGVGHVYDVESSREVFTVKGYGALFSSDGAFMATRQQGTARLYGSARGELRHEFITDVRSIISMAFSQDGSLLAVGSSDGVVIVYDIDTKNRLLNAMPVERRVRGIRFMRNEPSMIAFTDGGIYCFDLEGKTEWLSIGNNFGFYDGSIAPDGSTVIAVDQRDRMLVYFLDLHELQQIAPAHMPQIGVFKIK